jgi:hypothetical protein
MAANTAPIFSKQAVIGWGTLTTANTAKDGTGTVVTVFTADATEGGRLEEIVVRSLGTNVATVIRFFVNNGSTNATAANNSLLYELTIAATTLSEVAALPHNVYSIAKSLPPGYKINCTIGTTVAAGLSVVALGGKY